MAMCSLNGFPALPPKGEISLYQDQGKICAMPAESADISKLINTVATHPKISITREHTLSSIPRDSIFIPVSESLATRLINVWYENGMLDALELAAGSEGQGTSPLLSKAAFYILKLSKGITHICNMFHPHLWECGEKLIDGVSETRGWSRSVVRCIAWHPHCTKLAVAMWDESVRVFSSDSSLAPILKSKSQRSITSMAWRPLSASELAVGCEAGVFVWQVDPNSVVSRPSISCATFLQRPGHFPVTSVTWSPQGDLLLSCSAADTTMYVWDVAMERSVPLNRVAGGGISFVSWSPNGSKLFSATLGSIFRVWETRCWTPDRWTVTSGHVQTACWSPCSSYLLFCTTMEPIVYSLSFKKIKSLFRADSALVTLAVPLINLALTELEDGSCVGGLVVSMAWDTRGHYLALTFRDSDLVAVFRTHITSVLSASPGCFIRGISGELPNVITFQKNYEHGSLLTIAWSSGRIQYFPLVYTVVEPQDEDENVLNDLFDPSPSSSPSTSDYRVYSPSSYAPNPYTPDPYTPNPYTSNPYTPNPYTPNSYTPDPYAPSSYTPNPYAPSPHTPNVTTPTVYSTPANLGLRNMPLATSFRAM